MSGIVGLLDPRGCDPSELLAAAAAAEYRGQAQVRAVGPVLLGSLCREGEPSWSAETHRSLLAADARVDALLPGMQISRLAEKEDELGLLAAVLDQMGPAGLDGIAADFALARWDLDREELLLARDAFGLRPLFWAQQGGRVGFAADPAVLIALGLATGDVDGGVAIARLSGLDPAGERTSFAGVKRVPGGRWVAFDPLGGMRQGRWFRPESVSVHASSMQEASSRVRDAIVAAVESRTRGERSALLLSGGRDSGAVAVASRLAGVRQTCLTLQVESGADPPEGDAARSLAASLGHAWLSVDVSAEVGLEELEAIPDLTGDPLSYPVFPMARAYRDAAATVGAAVVLDGEGGDHLFTAHPVAVLDLALSARFRAAVAAARAYHHGWIYRYPRVVKSVMRALTPLPLLNLRERVRRRMPWAKAGAPRVDPLAAPRNAQEYRVKGLLQVGGSAYLELAEQLFQRAGIRYACPLFDQRVVRAALGLPLDLLVPVPGPKPVLAAALLGELDHSRLKAHYRRYYAGLARSLHRDFPWLFDSGSLCAERGFVRGGELRGVEPSLGWATLLVVPLEVWLRREEGRHGRG